MFGFSSETFEHCSEVTYVSHCLGDTQQTSTGQVRSPLFFGIWPGDKTEINKQVTDYLDLHFTELLSVQYVLSYHALPPTSSASSRPALGRR